VCHKARNRLALAETPTHYLPWAFDEDLNPSRQNRDTRYAQFHCSETKAFSREDPTVSQCHMDLGGDAKPSRVNGIHAIGP